MFETIVPVPGVNPDTPYSTSYVVVAVFVHVKVAPVALILFTPKTVGSVHLKTNFTSSTNQRSPN